MRVALTLRAYLFFCLFVGLVACQTKPTEIKSQMAVQAVSTDASEVEEVQKLIQANKVSILDTRSSQDFFLSHIPGAHFANPREYMSLKSTTDFYVLDDHESIARRWALLGLDPSRQVIVIGRGLEGQGEQAWWAWLLQGLGIKDVKLAHANEFRMRPYDPLEAKPENKAFWSPTSELNEVTAQQVRAVLKSRGLVLDVSSEASINVKGSLKKSWKDFFQKNSRVRKEVASELESMGIKKDQELLLICDNGLSAGAVSFAMQSLGFTKIKVYPGPLSRITSEKRF
jgi:thiosulfate/3-mercaptopyruvate sulfurtransferase